MLVIYGVLYLVGGVLFMLSYRRAKMAQTYTMLSNANRNPILGFLNAIVTLYVFPYTTIKAVALGFIFVLCHAFLLLCAVVEWTFIRK